VQQTLVEGSDNPLGFAPVTLVIIRAAKAAAS
jgi:hypothetical protein